MLIRFHFANVTCSSVFCAVIRRTDFCHLWKFFLNAALLNEPTSKCPVVVRYLKEVCWVISAGMSDLKREKARLVMIKQWKEYLLHFRTWTELKVEDFVPPNRYNSTINGDWTIQCKFFIFFLFLFSRLRIQQTKTFELNVDNHTQTGQNFKRFSLML